MRQAWCGRFVAAVAVFALMLSSTQHCSAVQPTAKDRGPWAWVDETEYGDFEEVSQGSKEEGEDDAHLGTNDDYEPWQWDYDLLCWWRLGAAIDDDRLFPQNYCRRQGDYRVVGSCPKENVGRFAPRVPDPTSPQRGLDHLSPSLVALVVVTISVVVGVAIGFLLARSKGPLRKAMATGIGQGSAHSWAQQNTRPM